MSSRINYAAIGAFVLAALVLSAGTALYFGGAGWSKDRDRFVVLFDSSVKGLNVGAPVALKGVQIGEVIEIGIEVNTDTIEAVMPVTIEIDNAAIRWTGGSAQEQYRQELIDRGLRAQLRTQSLLTGLLYVQLDFFPEYPATYKNVETRYPQFPTVPTDFEEWTRAIEEMDFNKLFDDIKSTAAGLNRLVNSEQTQQLPGRIDSTLTEFAALSQQLRQDLDTLVPRLEAVLDQGTTTLATVDGELPQFNTALQDSLEKFNATLEQLNSTASGLDAALAADSPAMVEIVGAAHELGRAARAMRSLANTLEKRPESLLRGKEPSP